MIWGCKGQRGHIGCWGCRGHRGCRGFKAWKITTEDFRVIQLLNLALCCCFEEKKLFLVESWNIMLKFTTFSVRGCWSQPMLRFWKLADETQMSKPLEATRHLFLFYSWSFYPHSFQLWHTLYKFIFFLTRVNSLHVNCKGQKIFVSMTWDILGHKYPFYNYSAVIKFYWTKLHLNSRNNANTPTFLQLKLTCLT